MDDFYYAFFSKGGNALRFTKEINIYAKDGILKRFQAVETDFKIEKGKISSLISESELIELQNSKATMYSKLASAILDINSLQLQFSDISSKYDTVTGKYRSLDAKVADYKAGLDGLSVNLTSLSTKINNDYSTTTAMNAAIKASVDGLSSTVSQTYVTGADVQAKLSAADSTAKGYADAAQKEAIKSANANTDELLKSYVTVTAMNSAIDQKAESITASVSSTYATKNNLSATNGKVSNLETWKADAETKITADAIVNTVTSSKSWETVTGLESWKAEASQKITDSAIVSTVTSSTSWSKKADKASLISQINQSAESISINASKINLNGVVTANSYFCILTDGSIKSVKGTLGGWTISSDKIQSRFAGIDAMTIHSDGYLKFGTCKISSTGGALTVKNGLHLYTNVNTDSSGFDDGTERFKIFGLGHVSSGGHLVFDSDGATVSYLSSSSRRYKNHIRDMTDNDIQNLYKLPTVFFVYKPGYLEKDSAIPIPGLYAEDVEQYLPLAARYQNGLIEDWNERAVIPYLIKAIQLQHEEIEALKRKVA